MGNWKPFPTTPYQDSLKGIKLHLGCNNIYLNDWINIDINSPVADMSCDIFKMNQFDDNSVELILFSHVIEHFCYEKHIPLYKEFYRILKPGGEIITECPNFATSIKKWQEKKTIEEKLKCSPEIFGRGDWNIYQVHQSGIWPEYLEDLLNKVGFSKVTHMSPRADDVQDVCMRIDARK